MDIFIVKFDSLCNRLWSTYYGGIKDDFGYKVSTDTLNNIYVCGSTNSYSGISTPNTYQSNFNGTPQDELLYDTYLLKFRRNGELQCCTYYGGTDADIGYDITCDAQNNAYIVGSTSSVDLSTTFGAHQVVYGGSGDGFIAKFSSCTSPNAPIISLHDTILESNSLINNQWYNQNGIINGATEQNYTPSVDGNYFVIVSDGECLSDTSNVITMTNVGIPAIAANSSIKISPNPVRNLLLIENIDAKTLISFEVYNATGNLIYKSNLQEKTMINTGNWANGVYIIKLENGNRYKFVKE